MQKPTIILETTLTDGQLKNAVANAAEHGITLNTQGGSFHRDGVGITYTVAPKTSGGVAGQRTTIDGSGRTVIVDAGGNPTDAGHTVVDEHVEASVDELGRPVVHEVDHTIVVTLNEKPFYVPIDLIAHHIKDWLGLA